MGERSHPFDMNLRLWSDDLPLGPVLAEAKLEPAHLHLRGAPIAETGSLAGRIARRHYASTAPAQGRDSEDMRAWLLATMGIVRNAARLREGLASNEVEGVLWVALLGRTALNMPEIEPGLAGDAEALGLKILVENYTRPEEAEPFPEKLWLAGAPAKERGA
jgi:hypothetical protein